jgi:hypothetical protein
VETSTAKAMSVVERNDLPDMMVPRCGVAIMPLTTPNGERQFPARGA